MKSSVLLTFVFLTSFALARPAVPIPAIAKDNPHIHVRAGLPRLAAAVDTAKKCHVAFLGGSITENQKGHTAMVPAWLKEKFPDVAFTSTNAGIGSTCSTTGAFRLSKDIFGGVPVDLLIVEFAVNDDQDGQHSRRECVRGMEGIIRQLRRDRPTCDVVMVHYVNPSMLERIGRGEVPVSIAAHEAVAEHYGVISVNVAAEISDGVKGRRYKWNDYGGTHPAKFGYQVASNMITTAIEAGLAKGEGAGKLPDPIDGDSYDGGGFVGVEKAVRSEGWKLGKVGRKLLPLGSIRGRFNDMAILRGEKAGDEIVLEFEGRAVGAYVLAGPDAGILEATIDGGKATTHDLYHRHSRGLNYPRSVVFAAGLAPGKHTLKLRLSAEKSPGSKGTSASILFFEVNR